jgi:hypothetical protein
MIRQYNMRHFNMRQSKIRQYKALCSDLQQAHLQLWDAQGIVLPMPSSPASTVARVTR